METREQLYERIWSKNLSATAAELGISAPVLRQLCLTWKIAVPGYGWKPANEPGKRIALPEKKGAFDLPVAMAAATGALHFPGETDQTFRIPDRLHSPAQLTINAQRTITEDHYLYGLKGMFRTGFGELHIRATRKHLDRALRIMDTLVKAWEGRGYRIVNQEKETRVYLREVSLRVGLRETTKTFPGEGRFDSRRYEPTGQLAFKVDGWLEKEWKDGKVPLEEHIKDIVDHMEVCARDLEASWAERKIREEQKAREIQAAESQIRNDTEEKVAFETLLQEAQRWHQFQVLDKYLDALGQIKPKSAAFEQWLRWAKHRRQVFDPVNDRAPGSG